MEHKEIENTQRQLQNKEHKRPTEAEKTNIVSKQSDRHSQLSKTFFTDRERQL